MLSTMFGKIPVLLLDKSKEECLPSSHFYLVITNFIHLLISNIRPLKNVYWKGNLSGSNEVFEGRAPYISQEINKTMQPASTKLYQPIELFYQLLSPLSYTRHFIFSYIKERKTEKEKTTKIKANRKLRSTTNRSQVQKRIVCKTIHDFSFVFVFYLYLNKCPCKNCTGFFLLQKSLVTQGICTKHKRVFSFHSCWVAAELFEKASLCRAIAENNYQVKQSLYPQ